MAWQIVSPVLVLFSTSLYLIIPTTCKESPFILGWKCMYSTGNYTQSSSYHSNLLAVFSNLTSLSSFNTFSNLTVGTDEDATNKVYALYDCRNDLPLRTCRYCIENATKILQLECPSKEAVIMYEECMLRYANRPIVSILEITLTSLTCDIGIISDGGVLKRTLEPLFRELIDEATSVNSSRYFAAGERSYLEYQKVYCLMQCTPDLSRGQCRECLMEGSMNFSLACANISRLLGLYYVPSCQVTYSVKPFFNLSSGLPPMASPPVRLGDGGQRLITSKGFAFLFFILLFSM